MADKASLEGRSDNASLDGVKNKEHHGRMEGLGLR